MKIKKIKFLGENLKIDIEGKQLERIFEALKYNCIKQILGTKHYRTIVLAIMRKAIGKHSITKKMQYKIIPTVGKIQERDIKSCVVTMENNTKLWFNLQNVPVIDLLQDIKDVIKCNQYQIYESNVKDKIILDVGANKGTFTLFALILGAKKVYSFEPAKKTYTNMLKNINLNNLSKKVVSSRVAIGEECGVGKIYYRYTGDGGGVINKRINDGYVWEEETIKIEKIDNLNIEQVDFIKIDTEGFEASVLKGARETIKKHKPILSFSAYHNKEDKEVLPKLVKEIEPNYQIKLNNFAEEDFYCEVKE